MGVTSQRHQSGVANASRLWRVLALTLRPARCTDPVCTFHSKYRTDLRIPRKS